MQIKVLQPGLLTTIQDNGRYGYQKYGVIVSGAMDTYALRTANILVGNAQSEGTLELTVLGPKLQFAADTLIVITGADLKPSVDGIAVPMWRPVMITQNSILEFGGCGRGCRAYLAVAGGFAVAKVMESKSTYCKAGFGGFKGRALQASDILAINETAWLSKYKKALHKAISGNIKTTDWYIAGDYLPEAAATIRFVKGSQYDWFTAASKADFADTLFEVTMHSDRMGYRLKGAKLERAVKQELISEAVGFGSVQVPPDGNPIILLADRQTAGGYSKIAQIISVDLPILAQLMPGSSIRFKEVSHDFAETELINQEKELRMLQQGVLAQLT